MARSYSLRSCQRFSIGLRSVGLRRSTPPVHTIFFKECLCTTKHMLGVVTLHEMVLSCQKPCTDEWQEALILFRMDTQKSAFIVPVNMQISVAPSILIPAQTCTFTGCFAWGLFFGNFPSFIQHLFWCVSSCADASSVQITFGIGH